MTNQDYIERLTKSGAEFVVSPSDFTARYARCKLFVFDWDGVFTKGENNATRTNFFYEADSMGTNLLRLSLWLKTGKMPPFLVISGAHTNPTVEQFVARENFNGLFLNSSHKIKALSEIERTYGVKPEEICFVYDDALDLSLAQAVGLRICIRRKTSLLFNEYISRRGLCDYLTSSDPGAYGIREICELMICLNGNYDETLDLRMEYTGKYSDYFKARRSVQTTKFRYEDNGYKSILPQ